MAGEPGLRSRLRRPPAETADAKGSARLACAQGAKWRAARRRDGHGRCERRQTLLSCESEPGADGRLSRRICDIKRTGNHSRSVCIAAMHSRRIRDKFHAGNGYTPTLKRRFARPGKETENPMGIIEGVLKTGVTLAV